MHCSKSRGGGKADTPALDTGAERYGGSSPPSDTECIDCGKKISYKAKRCKSCKGKNQSTKINWIPTKELIELVNSSSYSAVARQLGVSDNAVRKRIKNHL